LFHLPKHLNYAVIAVFYRASLSPEVCRKHAKEQQETSGLWFVLTLYYIGASIPYVSSAKRKFVISKFKDRDKGIVKTKKRGKIVVCADSSLYRVFYSLPLLLLPE